MSLPESKVESPVCTLCGHRTYVDADGICLAVVSPTTFRTHRCGCHCIFPPVESPEIAYTNHLRGCAECKVGLCAIGRRLWEANRFQPAQIAQAEIGVESPERPQEPPDRIWIGNEDGHGDRPGLWTFRKAHDDDIEYRRVLPDSQQTLPRMDWDQVAANGGPPCFHIETNTPDEHPQFCGRAERWQGHGVREFHNFVSLDDLLNTHVSTDSQKQKSACRCGTFFLDECRALLDGCDFVHTVIACPT